MVTVNENAPTTSIAQCEEGDIAIDGSADYDVIQSGVDEFGDSGFNDGSSWEAALNIGQSASGTTTSQVQAVVICFDFRPLET